MTFVVDPQDRQDYAVDFTDWLGAGETITAHTLTTSSGLTVDTDSHTTSAVIFWASGGTVGKRYDVTVHVTTSAGRQADRTARFLAIDR